MSLVDSINSNGCSIQIPYEEPSCTKMRLKCNQPRANYVKTYPPSLYIGSDRCNIEMSNPRNVSRIGHNKYVVVFGMDGFKSDAMIEIYDHSEK